MNTIDTLQSTSRVREYFDLWAQLISEYLSSLMRANVTATVAAPEDSPGGAWEEGEPGVWVDLAADSAAAQAFFLTGQDAHQLLHLLNSGHAGQNDVPAPGEPKALKEFFSRIAAKIPTADWLGSDTQLEVSNSKRPEWESAAETSFQFSTAQRPLLLLHALISTDFASVLQSAQETGRAEKQSQPAISPPPSRPAAEALRDNRLELLMDVELEVILRFGQREMLLRDVLNLAPGTVLELDQQVQDPVELLVGNKVIAWGEVVTVDGNYGLRITSLASRKERLESLGK